jgi:type I restriction enzyme, S subunit
VTWKATNLASLALSGPQYGANARAIPATGERPRYVRITDIDTNGNLIPTSIVEADIEEPSDFLLKEGDLLFARSGNTVGKTYRYSSKGGPCIFAGYLIRFRIHPKLADSQFVFYYTLSPDYNAWVMSKRRVAGQPNINGKEYASLRVPLFPLSEQHRIVEILNQADELRKKRAEADEKAARILPALFYKMFGDPATNPKGWRVVPIHKMIDPVERKDPSDHPYEPFTYIDIAGVDGVSGVITDVKRLTGAEAPSRARQIIKKNDVIISTVRPYLRATALVPMEYDNQICSTGFCVLRAKLGEGFGFLYALSRLQWFTDHLNARARGASYPAVTDRDILDFKVPIPDSREVLEQFDRQVIDIVVLEERQRKLGTKIGDLFDTLLHRAFTGDLTAKWREAHMKELLAEIEEQTKVLEQTSPTSTRATVRGRR